jgi:chemotaxis protein MotB
VSRRRKAEHHPNHERWLVSYADFITLLFAFFVVMYSTAQVDKQKVGKLALSIQVAFTELGVFPGSATPSPAPGKEPGGHLPASKPVPPADPSPDKQDENLAPLQQELERTLKSEILRNAVAIHTVPEGLVISLREVGFFDSGSASIQPQSRDAFGRIAALLLRYSHRVRIEGHTDNVPIHNLLFASNWELSTARATELVRLLMTNYQFPPARLSAAGYAEFHPVASNDTAEGRAQNRRVDIVVLGRQVATQPTGETVESETHSPLSKPDPATPIMSPAH